MVDMRIQLVRDFLGDSVPLRFRLWIRFYSNKCQSGTTIEAERTSFVKYI